MCMLRGGLCTTAAQAGPNVRVGARETGRARKKLDSCCRVQIERRGWDFRESQAGSGDGFVQWGQEDSTKLEHLDRQEKYEPNLNTSEGPGSAWGEALSRHPCL